MNCSRCDKPIGEDQESHICACHKGIICKNCVGYIDRQENHYCWEGNCLEVGQEFDYHREVNRGVL